MPRTISEFQAAMNTANGFARLSQFEVVITLPPRYNSNSSLMKTINILI